MKTLNTKLQDHCTDTPPMALVGALSASHFRMKDYVRDYKLKNYKKLLFVLFFPFFSLGALAMEQNNNVEDGTYRIRCKKGGQSLELSHKGTSVRLGTEETSEQYQQWSIKKNIKQKTYSISCYTQYKEERFLEAFPLINAVKPRQESSYEDDQEWQITMLEPAVYQIYCDTENCGNKYLEGYPVFSDIGLKNRTFDQDQKWELIRLGKL